MIVTVHKKHRRGSIVAGFVGDDAEDRAVDYVLSTEDPSALDMNISQGHRCAIQVRDLRAGDVLVPTLACVLGSRTLSGNVVPRPSAGTRTPRGKLDVLLRHPQGRLREATWGRYTTVTIIRHTEEELSND